MTGTLVVRVDAGNDIGLGHVMRTLAVAQAWRERKGRVLFAMSRGEAQVRERLAYDSIDVVHVPDDPKATVDLALRERAVVLVDGYAFDDSHQREIVSAGLTCVAVDDHARLQQYSAHVVVDPNVSADASKYRLVTAGSRLLAGLSYALIRREFRRAARGPRQPAKHVLVTFGGSDPARLTERALAALNDETELTVLIGGANPHAPAIERAARRFASARVVLDARDVSTHMVWADVAVSAAGTTCTELAYMGVPAIVIVAADNQRPVARGFEALGSVRVIGETDVDPRRIASAVDELLHDDVARATMRDCGTRAVDGRGPSRVVEVIEQRGVA